ncbi:MAG TPA: PfkB family carbohydrate kinase [Ignavibacteriaceae bacterium]|nr:PfkB family carbohydrate kinase [Ignavibacteriaceae bacterium]
MILIITLNPLLERRSTYNNVRYGSVNRNPSFELKPGGKGINVSRQLKLLGLSSYNLIFTGGNDGKVYRDILRREGFEFSSVQTESETRFASIIVEQKAVRITSFFSNDPVITEKECDEFISRIDKMIKNCEIVVFSGSSPKGAEKIIPACIEIANEYDKVSVCDTYGAPLAESINALPTIIHNNFDEIKMSLGLKLTEQSQIISHLQSIYSKGIKRQYLTDGKKPFFAANFDYFYKVQPPQVKTIDSTGSGDSFLAGIIYCWHNNLVFEDSLRFAAALGAINAASFNVSNVNPDEARALCESVQLDNVGKKIKTIDDSPV